MYKRASESRAAQRTIARHEEDSGPAPWLVVAFRVGRDNRQRERVYRRVWGHRTELAASKHRNSLPVSYEFRAVVRAVDGRAVWTGDPWLIVRWHRTRRQTNIGANWRLSATYADRAFRKEDRGASDEHRKLSAEERRRILEHFDAQAGRKG